MRGDVALKREDEKPDSYERRWKVLTYLMNF